MSYEDIEKRRAYQKKWSKENKEKKKEYSRKSYEKMKADPVRHAERLRKHYAYKKRPERIEKEKEYVRAFARKWMSHKLKTDPIVKLKNLLRLRMRAAIKNNFRSKLVCELSGVDNVQELKNHLEKQFKKGMSWDNHGEWHIDHIIPCASFDLTKKSEQKKCFHYTNLQPLWAFENLSKGAKYSGKSSTI